MLRPEGCSNVWYSFMDAGVGGMSVRCSRLRDTGCLFAWSMLLKMDVRGTRKQRAKKRKRVGTRTAWHIYAKRYDHTGVLMTYKPKNQYSKVRPEKIIFSSIKYTTKQKWEEVFYNSLLTALDTSWASTVGRCYGSPLHRSSDKPLEEWGYVAAFVAACGVGIVYNPLVFKSGFDFMRTQDHLIAGTPLEPFATKVMRWRVTGTEKTVVWWQCDGLGNQQRSGRLRKWWAVKFIDHTVVGRLWGNSYDP